GGVGGVGAPGGPRRPPPGGGLIERDKHPPLPPPLYPGATPPPPPAPNRSPNPGIPPQPPDKHGPMGEEHRGDKREGPRPRRRVLVSSADRVDVPIPYDYLILATGVRHSYFGHPEFEQFAPGLKSLADAVAIRNRILDAFEQAETEEDPRRHRDLLTFVLVGA